MNLSRIAVAAVVAWLVDSVYGFLVYGLALNSEFARYPAVFRSFDAVSGMLPLMFAGSLVGLFALAYIFAKGHDGGDGIAEGFRFGVILGVFMLGTVSVSSYVVYNYGRKLAVETAVAGFVEAIVVGLALGAVYKPEPRRKAVAV